MASLFDPISVGAIEAPNRIFMAPLTRGRSTRDHVPTPIMVEYYVCGIRLIRAAHVRWSPARTVKVNQARRDG